MDLTQNLAGSLATTELSCCKNLHFTHHQEKANEKRTLRQVFMACSDASNVSGPGLEEHDLAGSIGYYSFLSRRDD